MISTMKADLGVLDSTSGARREGPIRSLGFSYRSIRHCFGTVIRSYKLCSDCRSYHVQMGRPQVITKTFLLSNTIIKGSKREVKLDKDHAEDVELSVKVSSSYSVSDIYEDLMGVKPTSIYHR